MAGSFSLAGCATVPVKEKTSLIPETGFYGWQDHFNYGLKLISDDYTHKTQTAFARAAFESAARFSQDYAPAYAGLGYTHMQLGDFGQAQHAFLKAGLLSDNQFYWAMGALAALNSGHERAAYTFYTRMKTAEMHSADAITAFITEVYTSDETATHNQIDISPDNQTDTESDETIICEGKSDEETCSNLNIVAEIFFVRRAVSESQTIGNDIFNDLILQLGAQKVFSAERELPDDWQREVSEELSLTIPDIQYAVRALPIEDDANVYINASPSVMMTLGNPSEVREGSDRTILYNSEGFSDEFTAETGTTLVLEPDLATPDYCRMKIQFEYSSLSSLTPGANAIILDLTTSNYDLTGYFPYDMPVVLGRISSGTEETSSGGQAGMRVLPVIGNVTGDSTKLSRKTDTLVLARVSSPAVFSSSTENRILDTMSEQGVEVETIKSVTRRRIIHQTPDLRDALQNFLRKVE